VSVVGCVGEICINTVSETVVSHTPLAEMKQAAQARYDAHRDAIAAACFSAGDALLLRAGMPTDGACQL
jgi:hypothetical protein